MNDRETVADIVAQMRGRGEDGRMDRRLWLDYAARIEAAWNRERAKVEADALEAGGIVEAARTAEKSSAVGNAAAMREALVKIRDKCVIYNNDIGEEIDALCGNALSSPARNCDSPLVVDGPANRNADRAWLAFKRHNPDAYFDVSGLLRCIDWLFAPAAKWVLKKRAERGQL